MTPMEGHMASYIERRKFLATLGGAAVWPLAARAQQRAMPVTRIFVARPCCMYQARRMPQQMQELKRANVDVVVTVSYPAALIAKSSGIPTVIATGSGDPVASGLVASLARPGGNVTGLSDVATTLSTKRLSLLKELLPQLRRVAMLWNKGDRGSALRHHASAGGAAGDGVRAAPAGR